MTCPYLRCDEANSRCVAYLGGVMTPSAYEDENYCRTHLYPICVWFQSKREGVMTEPAAGSEALPVGAMQRLAVI
jgi:hypothetical protein